MTGLLRAVLAGLLLGAIVHIGIVISLPGRVTGGPGLRLAAVAGDGRFALIAPAAGPDAPIAGLDPFFVHAACAISTAAGPIRLRGPLPSTYWTLALVDSRGVVRRSVDEASAVAGTLDVIVAAAAGIETLRSESVPPEAILLAFDGAGVAFIRAFVGRDTAAPALESALSALSCIPLGER